MATPYDARPWLGFYSAAVPPNVPKPGHGADPRELIAFCALRLAEYKVPAVIEMRSELPHNMLGKVLRRVLREEQHQRTPG